MKTQIRPRIEISQHTPTALLKKFDQKGRPVWILSEKTAFWYSHLQQQLKKAKYQPVHLKIKNMNAILIPLYSIRKYNSRITLTDCQAFRLEIQNAFTLCFETLYETAAAFSDFDNIIQNMNLLQQSVDVFYKTYIDTDEYRATLPLGLSILKEAFLRGFIDDMASPDTYYLQEEFLNDICKQMKISMDTAITAINHVKNTYCYSKLYQDLYHKLPKEDLSFSDAW